MRLRLAAMKTSRSNEVSEVLDWKTRPANVSSTLVEEGSVRMRIYMHDFAFRSPWALWPQVWQWDPARTATPQPRHKVYCVMSVNAVLVGAVSL